MLSPQPSAPLRLLPSDGPPQSWQVQRTDNDTHPIRNVDTEVYVGFEGDPDPWRSARGYPEPREWQLTDGEQPDTAVGPGLPVSAALQRYSPDTFSFDNRICGLGPQTERDATQTTELAWAAAGSATLPPR